MWQKCMGLLRHSVVGYHIYYFSKWDCQKCALHYFIIGSSNGSVEGDFSPSGASVFYIQM